MTMTQTDINVPVDNSITSAKLSGDLVTPGALDVTGTVTVVGTTTSGVLLKSSSGASNGFKLYNDSGTDTAHLNNHFSGPMVFSTNNTERMRLTTTGLGIGVSSPADALHVLDSSGNAYASIGRGTQSQGEVGLRLRGGTSGNDWYVYQKTSSNNLNFYNTADRVTIDSSGNVGIGVSAPAEMLEIYNATSPAIQLNDGGEYQAIMRLAGNDLEIRGSSGSLEFYTGAADGDSSTERMRIDSSGNVGIGNTTFSSARVNSTHLVIGTGSNSPGITLYSDFNSQASLNFGDAASGTDSYDGGLVYAFGSGNPALTFHVNGGSERMRIDSGGSLIAGRTTALNSAHTFTKSQANNVALFENSLSSGNPYGVQVRFSQQDPNSTSSLFYGAYANSGSLVLRFGVRSNGGIVNFQANDANLSDKRVKRDISPLGYMWDKFKALEIVTFKYKDQTHDNDNIGVIAQQVESVAPEFVSNDGFGETPEGEEPLKTIFTTDLYHATIKALQEAMDRIETLEAKVQQLENN